MPMKNDYYDDDDYAETDDESVVVFTLADIRAVQTQLAQVAPMCDKCKSWAAVCKFGGVLYCNQCSNLKGDIQ